jgi:hypothetical protein
LILNLSGTYGSAPDTQREPPENNPQFAGKMNSGNIKCNMLIKSVKKALELPPEGEYPAELRTVNYKNEGKKCVLNFEISNEGKLILVPLEAPASFDSGPLRKNLEILGGVEFTSKQIEDGVEPEKYVDRKCRVLVTHKQTSGRKLVAVVNALMPAVTT